MRFFAMVVVVMTFSACASPQQSLPPPPPQPEVIDSNAQAMSSGFLLSPAEVKDLEQCAERGDRDAAFRLSFHFVSAEDNERARYWQLVAARNGHPVAQYNRWFDLKDKMDCASMEEALTWPTNSAASGFQDAQRALKHYEQQVESCRPTPQAP